MFSVPRSGVLQVNDTHHVPSVHDINRWDGQHGKMFRICVVTIKPVDGCVGVYRQT